ncbi:MAG: hypothetical protein R6V03_01490 [Kiritimatiellia bacterium]
MAHSVFHFAAAQAGATAILIFAALPKLLKRRPSAMIMGRGLTAVYLFSILAVVPSVLRHFGIISAGPAPFWMNIFVFHPLIDRAVDGGMLIGRLLLVTCFLTQYAVILYSLIRARKAILR